MIVLLTLNIAGADTGPFDLYSNLDGFTTPFVINVSKASLTAGYLANTPDYTQTIRVKSTGDCINYIDILLQNTTTTTTTGAPELPCNESVSSGGVGVTEYTLSLSPSGGLIAFAMNALGVPDKLEIIHNNVKKATSSMTTPNEGPFDNIYGDPLVPSTGQANATTQFIGSSKGSIPSRQATFTAETGSSLIMPGGNQQLIWWQYTPLDYSLNNKVLIRVTGPSGTAWNIQRMCEVTTTTTTTSVPSVFSYDINKGTQTCQVGYINIGGTLTVISAYSTIQRSSWTDGTILYNDNTLLNPIIDGYYRSVLGGSIDLFYFNTVNGVITNYTPPMTAC